MHHAEFDANTVAGPIAEGKEGQWVTFFNFLGCKTVRIELFWFGVVLGVVVYGMDGDPEFGVLREDEIIFGHFVFFGGAAEEKADRGVFAKGFWKREDIYLEVVFLLYIIFSHMY